MQTRQTKKLEFDALSAYGLRLLAQRALSGGEVRQKLRLRAASEDDVEKVIARLKALKVLDDRQYAGHYAEAQAQSNRVGRQRVMRELLQKRVAHAVAQQAVGEAFAGADENLQIEQFIQRKLRTQKPGEYFAEPKNMASMYRKLRMAGFSAGPSIRALKKFSAQAEVLESMEEQE